jgi:hypothetical protein
MVQGGGFEPPKLARQIYSLIPLATREPLRKEKNKIFLLSHLSKTTNEALKMELARGVEPPTG